MKQQLTHFIDGQPAQGRSKRFGDVFNPATGEAEKSVPLADEQDVATAVASATQAQIGWGLTSPQARARVFFKMVALINERMDDLATALSREHGKTVPDAKGEIQRGLEVCEFVAGAPHLLKGSFTENVGPGIDLYDMYQPVGVGVGITPFNFPAMIPLWMAAPAIACGNSFILKPSERDPSVPIMLAELFKEAGLPDGVLNVLHGDKEAVDALLAHPDVAAMSFVGSTPIAAHIYQAAAAQGKRVQTFGGAKNHMIIMPDADMDKASDALIGAGYGSAGERCMAISVAVPVGEETAQRLVASLKPKIEKLNVGPYTDDAADFGPLVTREALERVTSLVDRGVEEGAELVIDGRGYSRQGYEDGFFLGACLFDRVTADMDIYRQEIFGPVLSIVRANDYEQALRLPMEHEYGNGVAIFTRDGDTARDFASRINIGMVGINVAIPVPMAYCTFGGWKRSAFGDLNQYGPESMKFWTRTKTVTSRWPGGIKDGVKLSMPVLE